MLVTSTLSFCVEAPAKGDEPEKGEESRTVLRSMEELVSEDIGATGKEGGYRPASLLRKILSVPTVKPVEAESRGVAIRERARENESQA